MSSLVRLSNLRHFVRNRAAISTVFRAAAANPLTIQSRLCSAGQQMRGDKTSLVQAVTDDKSLTLQWQDGDVRLHNVWLRHHCSCSACLDSKTKMKTIDMALIPSRVQPKEVNVGSNDLNIVWDDGHNTTYELSWLREKYASGAFTPEKVKRGYGTIAYEDEMLLWNEDIIKENPPPEYNYHDLQNNDDTVNESLESIFRYGFTFINETPLTVESLANINRRIGGVVQDNLYSPVYVLQNKVLTHSDLAYLSNELHGHTDYTFFSEPSGLQAMHCTKNEAVGGVSLLVDAFRAAKTLYKEDPEAYKILTSTEVPFEYNSDEHRIRVHGPILHLDPFTQELKKIRYNNARVGPFLNMNLSFNELEEFYDAVRKFGTIVRRPENELWFQLTPGKAIVIDNRRVFHGRSTIKGSRTLMGSSVGMDDYMGRWRALKNKQ